MKKKPEICHIYYVSPLLTCLHVKDLSLRVTYSRAQSELYNYLTNKKYIWVDIAFYMLLSPNRHLSTIYICHGKTKDWACVYVHVGWGLFYPLEMSWMIHDMGLEKKKVTLPKQKAKRQSLFDPIWIFWEKSAWDSRTKAHRKYIFVITKYRHALEVFGGSVRFFKEEMEVFIDNIYCSCSSPIRMHDSSG